MDKDKKIRKVLVYLNNKISVVNQFETEEIKEILEDDDITLKEVCLLYTSPSPRDRTRSRMPSSA